MTPEAMTSGTQGAQGTESTAAAEESRWSSRAGVPSWLDFGARWSWRLVIVSAALAILWVVLNRTAVVVIPVLVAVIAAAVLSVPVGWLTRRIPRTAATFLVLLGVALLGAGLVLLVVPPLVESLSDLSNDVDRVIADVRDWARTGPLSLDLATVNELEQTARDQVTRLVDGVRERPASGARRLGEFAAGALLAFVVTFFLLKDGPELWAWILRHVRNDRRPVVDAAGRASFMTLRRWTLGTLLNGVIEAVSFGTILALVGAPALVPLIVLTFFAPFLPVIGATVTGVLAAALTLAFNGPTDALIVAGGALFVQQVEGNVLVPVIMRRAVALHPIVTLVGIGIGATIAGIVGALLAIPLTAAVSAATGAARHAAASATLAEKPHQPVSGLVIPTHPTHVSLDGDGARSPR